MQAELVTEYVRPLHRAIVRLCTPLANGYGDQTAPRVDAPPMLHLLAPTRLRCTSKLPKSWSISLISSKLNLYNVAYRDSFFLCPGSSSGRGELPPSPPTRHRRQANLQLPTLLARRCRCRYDAAQDGIFVQASRSTIDARILQTSRP